MSMINLLQEEAKNDKSEKSEEDRDCFNDLVEDMKTRTVLLQLEKYFKKWTIEEKMKNKEKWKIIHNPLILKSIKLCFLLVYSIMIFFETPFWCYHKTTFGIYSNKNHNECEPEINLFVGLFIPNLPYRIIELLFLLGFVILTYLLTGINIKLCSNFSESKHKPKIVICFIYLTISICFFDVILGLAFDYFPLLNFTFRSLLIILLSKSLRDEWKKIFQLIWEIRSVFIILTLNLFVFTMIGHVLFKKLPDFGTFFMALDSMFILMTTCNFPDIMLKSFSISKFSIFFFVSFLIINFFVLVSLLKALYYTNYLEITKRKADKFIEKIKTQKYIVDNKKVNHQLIKLNHSFCFNKSEYNRLKELIRLTTEVNNYKKLSSFVYTTQSQEDKVKIQKYSILKFIRKKTYEFCINVLNMLCLTLVFISEDKFWYNLFEIVLCLYFILEYCLYLKLYGIKKMIKNKKMRSLFCLINATCFTCLLVLSILENIDLNDPGDEMTNTLKLVIKPLIILRSTRLLFLLSSFQEYKIIFTTLNNMKNIFSIILASLFSFFLIFSTISMVIIGGKIRNDQHKGNPAIPEYYSYLNFNSYFSSFVSCFSLLMINNINIQTDALSQPIGGWIKPYFSLFYFVAILLILNVLQTHILDMYIVTKKAKRV